MTSRRLQQQFSLCLARGTERFGRVGWLGLALCIVAGMWFAYAWSRHSSGLAAAGGEPTIDVPLSRVAAPVAPEGGLVLARVEEQALLLAQVQQIAVGQGLGWTAADYKLVAASDNAPSSLEVRCTLKGTYPQLRSALARWLHQVPGLTVRDLAMSRPSSEVADVEAKLQLVIFMRPDAPEAKP